MAPSPPPSRRKPAATTPINVWKKHRQGRKLSSDCKQMVLSVYAKLREQYPDRLRNDLYQLTSEYTGVGARTVAIKKEAITNSGLLRTPTEGKAIYYLDETWVNAGHTINKIWVDTTVRSARDAGNRGLSTGLKNPSGKGSRLIVTHVGGDQGFVEGCLDIFHGVKSGDYHDEMDGNRFEHWFDLFLTKVEPGSVIVMDNASYHSRRVECVPTKSSTKSVIQEWLSSKGIDWDKDMLKVELISLVSQVRHKFLSYRVDTRAETVGCTVLRLPPYHCELNPIELIWGQVKNEVARSNSSFKLKDVKVLLEQAIKNVTKDNWTAAIQHVKKMEKQFWENDSLSDREVAPIIIEINAGDVSDDSYEDESCDEVVSGSGQPHIPGVEPLNM
ncbi:uncharacterized protein LOC121834080 [Ixodes scapularis]|uniref:uncharacterized protein LOC121834080 n=2 Tax=Ixodes scapularis TaxID=6945 RepID=UPI001C387EF3|nr:uncharacterized protein LOC121834080 [Ixodes scapularis]